jgi:hypothetical protein
MADPTYNDALFREMFPEFKDKTEYPESLIEAYYDMATLFIMGGSCPWSALSGKRLAAALNMLTAHLLVLGRQRDPDSGGESATGMQGGFITSATVGEVSVAALAPPAKDGWEWWLAGTPYGQELWALLKLLAVGGFALGGLPEREGFRKVGGVFW